MLGFGLLSVVDHYPQELGRTTADFYGELLEQVEAAETLGFESFWVAEHHFHEYGGIPRPPVWLAAGAMRTRRIRLGSAVVVLPFDNPLRTAEDYAMVDAISGGRLEFGIGSGNTEMDYKVFGVTRENDRQRLHEALEIVLKAWGHDHASHRGEFWRFDELTLYPRPMQQPHPPIWVAGTSAEGLGWAGRQGYHIMTVGHPHPPEKVRPGVEAWRQGLIQAGYKPEEKHCQFHARTYVNTNTERAREIAGAAITRYDEISRIGRRSLTAPPAEYNWDMMLATGRNNYGTPDQCIKNVHSAMNNYYFDTLTTTFNFGGIPHAEILQSMRLFAKEVMPAFR